MGAALEGHQHWLGLLWWGARWRGLGATLKRPVRVGRLSPPEMPRQGTWCLVGGLGVTETVPANDRSARWK